MKILEEVKGETYDRSPWRTRDVLTQSMAIFGYRKASLIAARRPACAQAVPCWSSVIRRLRKPGHEVGRLGWP